MDSVDVTLERIARSFTVRDIMVPICQMVLADDENDACQKLAIHKDFDVIPILRNGKVYRYLRRGDTRAKFVQIEETISDATCLLDCVDVLKDREFAFILRTNEIVGYIHFSDLNRSVVKIPYFVMFEALEAALVAKLNPIITGDTIRQLFGEETDKKVREELDRQKKSNTDLGWTDRLLFSQILKLAVQVAVLKLDEASLILLSSKRNNVDHATRPLIRKHQNIQELVTARNICQSALEQLKFS